MKAMNIIGIVLTVVLGVVTAYYVDEVSSAYWDSFFSSLDYGSDYGFYDYGRSPGDLTFEAGLFMMLFILFYSALYISNIVKVKTTTTKVLTIIGMSLTFIMLLWDVLMLISPRGISFHEVGPVYIIWGVINLAFCIVLLVQAVKYGNRNKKAGTVAKEIVDIEIE